MRIKYSEFNCDRGPLRFSAKEFEARLPYVYPQLLAKYRVSESEICLLKVRLCEEEKGNDKNFNLKKKI